MSNDTDKSLQMLSTALEMEKKGKSFYEMAVSTCQNEFGREIFQMLMKDEGMHMDRIFNIGIDLEFRAISFYQQHVAKAVDPLEREFVDQMITEEKSHHAALSDMKLYFSDPAAWFGEHERHILDGA